MSCAILILLFVFQRLGTSKLGHLFAPVILLWFFANFCIGIYNIIVWHPGMPFSSHETGERIHCSPAWLCTCICCVMISSLTSPHLRATEVFGVTEAHSNAPQCSKRMRYPCCCSHLYAYYAFAMVI